MVRVGGSLELGSRSDVRVMARLRFRFTGDIEVQGYGDAWVTLMVNVKHQLELGSGSDMRVSADRVRFSGNTVIELQLYGSGSEVRVYVLTGVTLKHMGEGETELQVYGASARVRIRVLLYNLAGVTETDGSGYDMSATERLSYRVTVRHG
ncbi:Leucine-Rich Repeat-Containing Protein 24 [Manis pentadactyla]|nr:Leucine-Rich Repeat-Containing Protein 24 [Manis pentadactyla]